MWERVGTIGRNVALSAPVRSVLTRISDVNVF